MGEFKGKLIHCNGIVECQEPIEELGYYVEGNDIDINSFRNIFFKDYNLDYVLSSALEYGIHFHIATHSTKTNTCKEKAKITNLPLERVIKGVYLRDSETGRDYALAIPGNRGYSLNKLAEFLKLTSKDAEKRISKTDEEFLPVGIKYGTVHPFVNLESFIPNGTLEYVLFDKEFKEKRKRENGLDDFSFTTHPSTGYDNHRLSIQINYWHAYTILRERFLDRVKAIDLI